MSMAPLLCAGLSLASPSSSQGPVTRSQAKAAAALSSSPAVPAGPIPVPAISSSRAVGTAKKGRLRSLLSGACWLAACLGRCCRASLVGATLQ